MTTFSVNQSVFGLFCIIIDLMVQDLSVLHPLFHCCGTFSYSCLFEELVDFGIDQLLLDESFLENGLSHNVFMSIWVVMKLVVICGFDAHLLHYLIFQFGVEAVVVQVNAHKSLVLGRLDALQYGHYLIVEIDS